MVRVSRFWSVYPSFEFFLLRINGVDKLEVLIDDSKNKSIWAANKLLLKYGEYGIVLAKAK